MSLLFSLKKVCYRTYHVVAGAAVKCIKFPGQNIISGTNALNGCADILEKRNIKSVFITCSKSVHKHGLMDGMLKGLEEKKIAYTIFEDINANPTVANVEAGLAIYKENNCEAIITVGGGSPMDCAKAIGLRISCPNLSYNDMRSMLKIHHRIPFTIAVPTTAGTGSESTVAAVISNPEKHDKYAIVSPFLMPHVVILDGNLTIGLSPEFTAYTGMDALTHAIEAYIGVMDTKLTSKEALEACKLVFEYLQTAYHHPDNLEARNQMLVASNKAGVAFTRVYVGYVHSLSHAMSALYNVGHGKTNATILPVMLDYYGSSIYKKMGEIARYCSIGSATASDRELTELLIDRIRKLNEEFSIPSCVEELKEEDIPTVVKKALKEANPGYPVPKIMDKSDCTACCMKLLKK